jgi:hypothetical protein
MSAKSVTIRDFLTDDQITSAIKIYEGDLDNFHKRCLDEVIKPNMEEINRKLAQINSPEYLAYVILYVLTHRSTT